MPMRDEYRLRADCARCCGLCCVAPAFDADQGFGFDKPAHTACRNLERNHRCTIHDELRDRGFPACATFDCFGAGQWVTQQLFGGKSWQTSPEIAARMFRLYARYRVLHELMALLELGMRRVPPAEAIPLERCLRKIEALCQVGVDPACRIDVEALSKTVRALVREQLRR
jgi:hypothetical protein